MDYLLKINFKLTQTAFGLDKTPMGLIQILLGLVKEHPRSAKIQSQILDTI